MKMDAFDLFGVEESASSPMHDVENLLGEMPQTLAAQRLVKDEGLRGVDPAVKHFFKSKAWAITTHARSAEEAAKIGKRVQSKLVSKRSLSASDPYMHDLDLYVVYDGGFVKLENEPKVEKVKAPGKRDVRDDILRKGKSVLGESGFKIGGREGAYHMRLIPALKKFKGKFSETSVSASTLEELDAKLDTVIEKLRGME